MNKYTGKPEVEQISHIDNLDLKSVQLVMTCSKIVVHYSYMCTIPYKLEKKNFRVLILTECGR